MSSSVTLESVKKAVFFPFQGPRWGLKILIGGVLVFANFIIPFIPYLPLMGYFGQIMKRIIIADEDPQLPEWNDWGVLFLDGVKILGVSLIYTLPGIILMISGYFLFLFLDFAMAFSISGPQYPSTNYSSVPGYLLGMFGGLLVMMVGMFLMFPASLLLPPSLGNMIARGRFGAAFKFSEWWPIFKNNFTGYLIAILLTMGLSFTMLFIFQVLYATIVLCFLLPFLLSFIGFIVGAAGFSLYAVAYRDGTRQSVKPPA